MDPLVFDCMAMYSESCASERLASIDCRMAVLKLMEEDTCGKLSRT